MMDVLLCKGFVLSNHITRGRWLLLLCRKVTGWPIKVKTVWMYKMNCHIEANHTPYVPCNQPISLYLLNNNDQTWYNAKSSNTFGIHYIMSQRVLITGASKGIGRAIAAELIKKGYIVLGTCRDPENLTDKISGVTYLNLDLSSEESICACAKSAGEIDILINNAGQSQIGSAEETSVKDYKDLFQINFFGMAQLTSLLIPYMREQRSGKIINTGSLMASFPIAYYSCYSSTKAATQAYSFALDMELRPFGIQVALVEPNDVRTSIVPHLITKVNSPYAPFIRHIADRVRQNMLKASDPAIVARKVAAIIDKKQIRPYYTIGASSKMLLFCKRFATQHFVNKNVYKQYGLADIHIG